MRRVRIGTLVAALLSFVASVQAAPTIVPYLGYLTHEAGGTVNAAFDIQVQVFSSQFGDTSLWGPHSFEGVAVTDGLFSLPLGGNGSQDLAPALDVGSPLWLAFTINGVAMTPRQQILSVPFARRAELAANSTHLGGLAASAYATVLSLPNAALSGSFDDLLDVPTDLAQAAGTAGSVARFTGTSSLGDSIIVATDSAVGVGHADPQSTLHVGGTIQLGDDGGPCTAARSGSLRWTGTTVQVCNGTAWTSLGTGSGEGEGPGPGDGPCNPISTHVFSTCGASGPNGPNQTQCNSAYGGPVVNVLAGIQTWNVPATAVYRIEGRGARGGGLDGGRGAILAANFSLTAGQQIQLLVGQQGTNGSNGFGAGGGGSFVVVAGGSPLLIAGGGGGDGNNGNGCRNDGTTLKRGRNGFNYSSCDNNNDVYSDYGYQQGMWGGENGNGGANGTRGGGGGGFFTSGNSIFVYSSSLFFGAGYNAGGTGGPGSLANGGFGGGGGCNSQGGAGGGGFSGGGGGSNEAGGGGGGSYISSAALGQIATSDGSYDGASLGITNLNAWSMGAGTITIQGCAP